VPSEKFHNEPARYPRNRFKWKNKREYSRQSINKICV